MSSLYCIRRIKSRSPNSERSGLRFETGNPVFVKRDMGVYMVDLLEEICKPVLKLDFTAHGVIESLQNLDSACTV
jgi:hypothetical protein